jgi:hypothetical protein
LIIRRAASGRKVDSSRPSAAARLPSEADPLRATRSQGCGFELVLPARLALEATILLGGMCLRTTEERGPRSTSRSQPATSKPGIRCRGTESPGAGCDRAQPPVHSGNPRLLLESSKPPSKIKETRRELRLARRRGPVIQPKSNRNKHRVPLTKMARGEGTIRRRAASGLASGEADSPHCGDSFVSCWLLSCFTPPNLWMT